MPISTQNVKLACIVIWNVLDARKFSLEFNFGLQQLDKQKYAVCQSPICVQIVLSVKYVQYVIEKNRGTLDTQRLTLDTHSHTIWLYS